MVEIYNEQVRDLLSNDVVHKRYPYFSLYFFVHFSVLIFNYKYDISHRHIDMLLFH
jgi:hypothetical protein